MEVTSQIAAQTTKLPSTKMIWIGRFATALSSLFMLFVAVVKLMRPAAVIEGFAHYGTRNT
jgi:hypothetical protein